MMMRRMFAAGTLLVLSMSPCASGAGDGPNPSASAASQLLSTAGSTGHGDLRLRINPDALITLQEQPGPITLTLPLNPNETISLRMERFEVVASDTRILRGDRAGSAPMPTPQVVLLRGEIIGRQPRVRSSRLIWRVAAADRSRAAPARSTTSPPTTLTVNQSA